jgi:hypothetical protein
VNINIPTEDVIYDEIKLKLLRSEVSEQFSGVALQQLKVDKHINYITDGIIYKVSTLIPAEDIKTEKHTITITYPDGWWQAFKEEYFSNWLKKKFPVRYVNKKETVTFEAYAIYPKLPIVMPKCGEHRFITIKYVDSIGEAKVANEMTKSQRETAVQWKKVVSTTPKDL